MTGGLGNQMFIYAFYLKMRTLYPDTRIDLSDMVHYHAHNGYELHRIFPSLKAEEICIHQGTKKAMEFLFFKTILERKQRQDTLRPFFGKRLWPWVYFKGFYQSERYFSDVAEEVRSAFTFDLNKASERTLRLLERIDADTTAVSVHVRRGDYLQPSVWANTGCVCNSGYYRHAVDALEERVVEPHYYVFSDDIHWASTHLPLSNATFVSWNLNGSSWQDMMLMSHCRHHIICNSTFSWWGAYLNARKDKIVIAPARWSAKSEQPYICPETWVRVPVDLEGE